MNKISIPEEQHNIEIHDNLKSWQNKPVLQKIYHSFYQLIASYVNTEINGKIVELGSGIGNMKMVIPEVVCTDLFKNPWIDQVESAYQLSFENESVSNIILFDVWHHLEYPGNALKELNRVLKPNGRLIIFEPAMSLAGLLVYGLFHHEPIGLFNKIKWFVENENDLKKDEYYAAQGNATRIFGSSKYMSLFIDYKMVKIKKMSSISYVLSGGYSKKQLYPDSFLPFLSLIDKILDWVPVLFATRMLVVLDKKYTPL